MKRKVLFVITKSNWGGAQRYVFDIATAIADTYTCVVALGGTGTRNAPAGLLASALEQAGIRTVQITAFMRNISLPQELRAFFELRRLFLKEKPDVVHLNSSKAGGLGALAARFAHVPTIVFTAHGLPYEEDRPFLQKGIIFCVTWCTFLLATHVIAIAEPHYAAIRRMWGCKKKVVLIHNGIPPLSYVPREEGRKELATRAFTALPPQTVWIGCIAEYTKNKGLLYLVDAVHQLRQQNMLVALFLIGEGEERRRLEQHIEHLQAQQYVFLCGFMEQAYRYTPSFDLMVLPSLKEGLPYTLLEAGQAGAAVVASAVGGIPDIIEQRVSGLLCEPKGTEALARALDILVKNTALRETYIANLQHKVKEVFSLTTMVAKTAALYSTTS